jgi:hypothetical protein
MQEIKKSPASSRNGGFSMISEVYKHFSKKAALAVIR